MNPEQFDAIIVRLDRLCGDLPLRSEFYKIEEIAKKLKVSRAVIDRAIKDKQLRGYRIGGAWRITEGQVNEWLRTRCPAK